MHSRGEFVVCPLFRLFVPYFAYFASDRLGGNVILSARAKDNAGLEEFMMREFF